MLEDPFTEKDWKLFRARLPQWQLNYMERLCQKYIALLSSTEKNSGERFWELEKQIQQDKKHVGVDCEMKRSLLVSNLSSLILEGAIVEDDLDGFSQELRDAVSTFCRLLSRV